MGTTASTPRPFAAALGVVGLSLLAGCGAAPGSGPATTAGTAPTATTASVGPCDLDTTERVAVDLGDVVPESSRDLLGVTAEVALPEVGTAETLALFSGQAQHAVRYLEADLGAEPVTVEVVVRQGDGGGGGGGAGTETYRARTTATPQPYRPGDGACGGEERYSLDLVATPDGTLVPYPRGASPRADAQGRLPYALFTHCGIERLEVDGSVYQRVGGLLDDGGRNPPDGWDNPEQLGWVELSGTRAVFTDDAGHREDFALVRDPGPGEPCARGARRRLDAGSPGPDVVVPGLLGGPPRWTPVGQSIECGPNISTSRSTSWCTSCEADSQSKRSSASSTVAASTASAAPSSRTSWKMFVPGSPLPDADQLTRHEVTSAPQGRRRVTASRSPRGYPRSAARPETSTSRHRVSRTMVVPTQPLAAVTSRSKIIDEVASTYERVTVTRNGGPVAVIVAVDDVESLTETLEILSDPATTASLRQAESDLADGLGEDEAQVRAALAARRA